MDLTSAELVSRVQYLQELRRMSEELSGEIEGVQNEIKAHMTANALTELTAGPFKVTWATVASTRIDVKALARDYPDLAERYTRTTQSRRFQVK